MKLVIILLSASKAVRATFSRPFLRNFHKIAPLVLSASLFGCSTPATRTQTVEVKIPVAVQPIKAEQVPTPPAPLPKRPDSLSAAADLLLSKWCEAVSYVLRSDPLLRVSSGQPQRELSKYPECER